MNRMQELARRGHTFEAAQSRHIKLATALVEEGYSFVGMMQEHLTDVSDLIRTAEGIDWVRPEDSSVGGVVALDANQTIVGVAIVGAWERAGTFNVHLQHLSVAEHARGKGIGSVLAGMLTQLTGQPATITYCGIEPTAAAYRFYQQLGFDIHYPDEPALIGGVVLGNNNPRFRSWATRAW